MAAPGPRKKRVLFVINSLAGGGAERVMMALLDASSDMRADYDISLALLDREQRDYAPPAWLDVRQLDGRFKLARSVLQLYRLARRERPDVTLSFLTRSNIASVVAARLLGHKAIISERANTSGHFAPGPAGRAAKAMIRLAYPRADHVIAVSRGIADDLVHAFGVDPLKIGTIANPVDADRIRAAAAEPPAIPLPGRYIVAVSRLTKGKNVSLLVDALARARIDLPLVVLGEGPEREAIVERAAALNLSERVILPGFVANPYTVMRGAACYVSASNGEGFPNGLVEALALGLPAVMTNCASGPSEILADMRREDIVGLHAAPYGILAPQNDAEAFARGIHLALDDARAAPYRISGPRRAAEFSVEAASARYWDLIRRVLGIASKEAARIADLH